MKMELTHKECATLIAALKAWNDPAGYLLGEDGTFAVYSQSPLSHREISTLISRLKFALNEPAGSRT